MKTRKRLGIIGEQRAVSYLEHLGYQILETNFRSGRGEIDIIGIREYLLVFVEVKTKSSSLIRVPMQKVRWNQQQKIRKTAQRYLKNSCWGGRVRFDVIVVYLGGDESVHHYQGYFR